MLNIFIVSAKNVGLVIEKEHTDGRKYLLAPTIALKEGVMNEVLYLGSEISAYIDAWNGRPLVINHPKDEHGEFVSANDPDKLPEVLGFYYNAAYEDGRLKGEWWLDIEKAKKHPQGLAVLNALRSGQVLEQSTGLFTDVEETSGEFNGVPYTEIARNIRPDHVAILLDEEGACSVADGCGTPRVNTSEDTQPNIVIELSSIKKTLKGFSKILSNLITTVSGFNVHREDNQMNREELIAWILENSPTLYTREMLDLATDEDLAAIAAAVQPLVEAAASQRELGNEEPETHDATGGAEGAITPTPTPAPTTPTPITTPAPELAAVAGAGVTNLLPPEVAAFMEMLTEMGGLGSLREIIEKSRQDQVEQFDGLVEMLVNSSGYSREDLTVLPVTFLQKMVANMAVQNYTNMPDTPPDAGPTYGARVLGNNAQAPSDWETYTLAKGGA